MPFRKSSYWIDKRGYAWIEIDGKAILEHRYIAEKALGKKLPPQAVVHHLDEDPLNNDPSNLVICENRTYHSLIHQRAKKLKIEYDDDVYYFYAPYYKEFWERPAMLPFCSLIGDKK